MARISTYALDTDITTNDKVIGTDSAGTITKNYKVSDLFGFLNLFDYLYLLLTR